MKTLTLDTQPSIRSISKFRNPQNPQEETRRTKTMLTQRPSEKTRWFRNAVTAILFVTAISAASSATLQAASPSDSFAPADLETRLSDMMGEADLVMHGTVRYIDYVMSEPSEESPTALPHTFITYRVQEVIKGRLTDDYITLRFIGGLDHSSLRLFVSSEAPMFDVGDEDILFIKGNGSRQVPLVKGRQGRLRVIKQQVYTDGGCEIALNEEGKLSPGKSHRFFEVLATDFEGKPMITGDLDQLQEGPTDAVYLDEFVTKMSGIKAPGGSSEMFKSADPMVPFAGPDLRPVAPPVVSDFEETEELEERTPFDPEY
jgi:hypothetical protein